MSTFERTVIVEKVIEELGKKLRGDETKSQVEDLVEDLLGEQFM